MWPRDAGEHNHFWTQISDMRESRIQIERMHRADQLTLANKLESAIARKGEVTSRES